MAISGIRIPYRVMLPASDFYESPLHVFAIHTDLDASFVSGLTVDTKSAGTAGV